MKNTVINGITFYFKNYSIVKNGKCDIFDLYNKPSYTKIRIFNEWQKKLNCIYGLTGNSCTYSIYGNIMDQAGKIHDIKITKGNNYVLN